jgi:hypothetical protein
MGRVSNGLKEVAGTTQASKGHCDKMSERSEWQAAMRWTGIWYPVHLFSQRLNENVK